jgi:hypothetical protein
MIRKISIIIFCLSLGGCISRPIGDAYISSQVEDPSAVDKKYSIYVWVAPDSSMEDRKFASFIKSQMRTAGFKISENASTSIYALSFSKEEKKSDINSVSYVPQKSYSYGSVGGENYSGETTSHVAVPTVRKYTVTKINLWLQPTGKKGTVWEGRIGVESSLFEKYPNEVMLLLLNEFGKDYKDYKEIHKLKE